MKTHGEIYRVAFDAAQAELAEITAEFERLRVRKGHVEQLILVLKPILGEIEAPAPAPVKDEPMGRAEATPSREAASEEAAQPLGVGADPFQRRVEHVLGIGAGIRDVRQYTRQF
ncbi:hypothetical protein [Occallatibacter savannae]|uniref:hypothetical protein n=1 Tax=Occallatibacter savannae TaxID=1002691 RepID=UPI000D6941A6|nr:hypothetical protein [Occallatibacter savannae]